MSNSKRVLVCPLDWGLGHATRCIPIIHALINEGAEVIIAADSGPLALLKQEFPGLTFIRLPDYQIHYSKRLSMTLSMMLQSPKILFNIFREHRRLKRIIAEHKIDCVISDNRYGLWNKSVHCVFMTHQLFIKCPPALRFIEPLIYRINSFFINKYNECWIPDVEDDDNLSGALSHKKQLLKHGTFIGMLSRFESANGEKPVKEYDLMAIISGPEPHRSLFCESLLDQLSLLDLNCLVVGGEPGKSYDEMLGKKIRLVSHLSTCNMREAILQSDVVVCRAGYSGIMDLVTLEKQAILIPTPGQTEQEYLAQYLKERNVFYSVNQKEFNIQVALKEVNRFGTSSKTKREKKYLPAIKRLMQKINT